MPQSTPSASPPTIFHSSPSQSASGTTLDVRRAEQLEALHRAVGDSLTLLAVLGCDVDEHSEWGSAAFLAREHSTGSLLVAALNERVGAAAGYDVTLWRSLE